MTLIAGPCVLEDLGTATETAKELVNITKDKDINFYFKSSCVKDNRTSSTSWQGPGFTTGMTYLLSIKQRYNCMITTDFHTIGQIKKYAKFVDLVQIPAYLAKQRSLIDAAFTYANYVHIKKPQFMGPLEFSKYINDIYSRNYPKPIDITITDRGTMFGYNQTIMDPRHIPILKSSMADKILVDITHPNKNYPMSSREMVETLAMSAIAVGADGFFVETHPRCSEALCDAETMYPLEHIEKLIERTYELYTLINN